MNAIPLEILREAPELEIRTGFEKQSEVVCRLVTEELIDLGGVSSFKLKAESRSKIWTELASDTVVVEIGNTTVDTDGDFISPK